MKIKCLLVSSTLCLLAVNTVGAYPQWVWNRNISPDQTNSGNYQNSNSGGGSDIKFGSSSFNNNNNGNRGDRDRFFVGQSSNPPASNRVEGQSRLIPSAISAISNSISSITGGLGGGGGGGGSGIFGALSSFPQIIAGLISGNRYPAATLPDKAPSFPPSGGGGNGGGGGGSSGGGGGGSGNCKCFNTCVVPFIDEGGQGSCGGGQRMCCQRSGGTRIPFESQSEGERERERPIRNNAFVRQGLFNEIVKGSSRIVDDTLDLLLQPFLTEEDQQRLADRIADN